MSARRQDGEAGEVVKRKHAAHVCEDLARRDPHGLDNVANERYSENVVQAGDRLVKLRRPLAVNPPPLTPLCTPVAVPFGLDQPPGRDR